MSLPPAAPRQLIHRRVVTCEGYARDDGLWDIEGTLVDTKTYAFDNQDRGTIQPGEPIHQMTLRLTVDVDLLIHQAAAVTEHGPFHCCPEAAPRYEALAGLRIGPGFRVEAKKRLGGPLGCTHISELLGPMGTTAIQTLIKAREERRKAEEAAGTRQPGDGLARVIDTCHAFRADGPVVRREREGGERVRKDTPPTTTASGVCSSSGS